jgi:hypothetical protein
MIRVLSAILFISSACAEQTTFGAGAEPARSMIAEALECGKARFNVVLPSEVVVDFKLHVMLPDDFTNTLQVPNWVQSVYIAPTIYLQLDSSQGVSIEKLCTSIAHELTHAMVYKISNGKAPIWLDEGLALYVDGSKTKKQPIDITQCQNWALHTPAERSWLH